MVKVSHAKCRQCGQSRHRNAKRNLCMRCWLKVKPQVIQEWREIKERRALKRNGAVHTEAELVIAAAVDQALEETKESVPNPRAPRVYLTSEQEQEVINLYTTTDTPTTEIAETYGLPHTGPYRILTKNGISWRRGDSQPAPQRKLPPHIEAMKDVHVADPTPPHTPVLDAMLEAAIAVAPMTPAPTPPTARPSVPAAPPTPDGVDAESTVESLSRWRVEFSGYRDVVAESARDAIAAAEAAGALEITLVRKIS